MGWMRRDLHRLLSVPTPWILLAMEVIFALGMCGSMKLLSDTPSPAMALGFVPAVAGVFGAVSAGADFRFGAVPTEVLVVGGPLRYFLRTFSAVAIVAAVGGGIGAALTAGTWTLLQQQVPDPTRTTALVAAGVVASACWALVGAITAVLTRSQIGAVAAVLAYLMFIEPVLEVSTKDLDHLLPGHVAVGLFGQESPVTVGVAGYPLAALAVVLAGVVCLFVRRREIAVTTS